MSKYLGAEMVDLSELDLSSLNSFGESLTDEAYSAAKSPIYYHKGSGNVHRALDQNRISTGMGLVFFANSKEVMKFYMRQWQQYCGHDYKITADFNICLIYGHYKGKGRATTIGKLIRGKFATLASNYKDGKNGTYKYADAKVDAMYHNVKNDFYFCYVGHVLVDHSLKSVALMTTTIDVMTVAAHLG